MFNNFINIHDFSILYEKIQEKKFFEIIGKITRSKNYRVKKTWEHVASQKKQWWDIPAINKRWNYLITGNSEILPHEYVIKKYFPRLVNFGKLKGLSLACGNGNREIEWARTGSFITLDAFDISSTRIQKAKKTAEEKLLENITNFFVADVKNFSFQKEYYDIVIAEGALHHFSDVKEVVKKIYESLKPGGFLILNDFVGPSQFQWADKQLKIVNAVLELLPLEYKLQYNNKVKKKVYKPGKISLKLHDPSEAIESDKILLSIKEIFHQCEIKFYGGTILMLLFKNIAHNFIIEKKITKNLLQLCFDIEDFFLQNGEIQSDFVYAIFSKKN